MTATRATRPESCSAWSTPCSKRARWAFATMVCAGAIPAVAHAQDPAPVKQQQSPVQQRESLNDRQEGAPRPGDFALDPELIGFIPVPNTPVLIRFNARPRADMTMDNRNAGDDSRFVTAVIPVKSDPAFGGGGVFNINAKGSQMSLDVRAPGIDGSPRFFYQNDFYGDDDGEFPYRVDLLYGEIYNVVVGMTYSVFEDPDAWPDTVDYEGPNSAIFARRPLARVMLQLTDAWHVNLGVEQPESEVDNSIDPNGSGVNHWPDVGANIRWEAEEVGHVQVAAIVRQIGYDGPVTGHQRTLGWGVNAAAAFSLFESDSVQGQVTYGEGIFRYLNDNFVANDAAFDEDGDLTAIPCLAVMLGYTHQWNEAWRSTASWGRVSLDNQSSQDPTAYATTQYASLNVIWQIRKRLTLGLEGLYGSKEQNDGDEGNVFRVHFGLVYSLFE